MSCSEITLRMCLISFTDSCGHKREKGTIYQCLEHFTNRIPPNVSYNFKSDETFRIMGTGCSVPKENFSELYNENCSPIELQRKLEKQNVH